MTKKQRKLIVALGKGMDIEEAAKISGYNLEYASKLANEPKIIQAVETFKAKTAQPIKAEPVKVQEDSDPMDVLEAIINDPTADDALKINAIRAMATLRRLQEPAPMPPPVIIDDIPRCINCPLPPEERRYKTVLIN